jgi:guanine deaminase
MSYQPNKEFMRKAIELSERAGIKEKTGGVFGAVVVKNNKIIGEGYNQVIKHNDPTWHGEIQAIREACKHEGSPHLEGAVVYTSAEPCPMCYAACCWAHVAHVFYGAKIEDAKKYGDFDDADFYSEICKNNKDRIVQTSELLRDEAVEVWKRFSQMPDRNKY